MRTFLLPRVRWLSVLAWAGAIFVLSAQPDLRISPLADLELVARKIGHMLAFGLLAVLLRLALESSAVRRSWQWSLGLAVLYAISDEIHQGFTPGRHPAATDVAIDAVGALLALALLAAWRWFYSSATGRPRMLKPPST
jgi:VanZ family protein